MVEAAQDPARVTRAYTDMWNERAYSRIPDIVTESFVVYNPVLPEGEARGRDGLEEWMRTVTSSFPDFRVDITNLLTAEEIGLVEVTYAMTHEGEFMDIEPTGNTVELAGAVKLRLEDGKITEHHDYVDRRALFEQLGIADE